MGQMHSKRFPGEDSDYRLARDELLEAEIALRRQVEQVASMRRSLPTGGPPPEDYVFQEGSRDLSKNGAANDVRLSELFEDGKNTLVLYSFMYGPEAKSPCVMCTALLDSLNGNAQHAAQRINFAVVAKGPIEKTRDWARTREWNNLRLLSSEKNSYNSDYFAETPEGDQLPLCNVFVKTPEGIRHSYGTEMLFTKSDDGQHFRHLDLMWPLWNLFDLTPDGRGQDWFPGTSY